MGIRQVLVLAAIAAVIVTGMPDRAMTARPCAGCCVQMAPCCEMVPTSPETPARIQDRLELTAPLGAGLAPQIAQVAVTPGLASGRARLSDRHARRPRTSVLRI